MMNRDVEKYILYGAGHDGVVAMNYLGKDNILCFCDRKMQGESVEGIPVVDPSELPTKAKSGKVVIAVSKPNYLMEISRRLSEEGIDYVFWLDLANEIIREEGKAFLCQKSKSNFKYDPASEYLIATDRYSDAGSVNSYFWQDLWAARHIYARRPSMHYDIGSRVDGFITHLLTFGQKVTQIDIRPLDVSVEGYGFVQADATNLNGIEDESIDSLSALCSLEHFGLGRYGDPLDPEACFKCFKSIKRVLRKNGYAYISVPIGKEHLEFNAHRVFYPQTVVDSFAGLRLIEFSSCYGTEIENDIDIHKYDNLSEYGGDRFGLFRFQKI